MGIIWLASYPKSGNTWLRIFLYYYLFGELRKSDDLASNIPDLHVRSIVKPSNSGGATLYKTHFLWSPQHPHIDQSSGFIYVLRHPKDVLLSNLNYIRLVGNDTISDAQFARRFIEQLGVPQWRRLGMGSWPEHAQSWLHNPQMPHLVLRYEQLRENPKHYFSQAIEFLGMEVDEHRLNRAIFASSLGEVKKFEERERKKGLHREIFAGSQEAAQKGFRFINEGKTGQTLAHIDQRLDGEFDRAFKDSLVEFGFT